MIKALSNLLMRRLALPVLIGMTACGLSACDHNYITEPEQLVTESHVDVGPPEYRQGFADGCHTAMAAYGTSWMKTMYKIHKDPKYADNKMYNQAWKDAWGYCYMSIFLQRTDDDSLL